MVAQTVSKNGIRYVPILKTKKAEFWSVANLTPNARAAITPLFEMTGVPKKRKKKNPVNASEPPKLEKPPKAFSEHTADKCKKIAAAWGTKEFFLDHHRWI